MDSDSTVLLVTSNFPPEIGGPAKFTSDFANWLTEKEVPCCVIATAPTSSKVSIKTSQVILVGRNSSIFKRVLRTILCVKRMRSKRVVLVSGLFYEALLCKIMFRLRFIAKVPSDVVWDRARNNKATNLDVDSFQGNENGIYKLQRHLFTRSLKSAKHVIVPSNHLAHLAKNWGIPENRITVIRNSERISPKMEKAEKSYDLVSVGRLIPLKGNEELIRAVARLKLSLLIIGDGQEMNFLQTLARELGAKVTFLGSVSHEEVLKCMRLSRIFVINSSHEGSPNSLIEAMALGLPVIARANSGTKELITNFENGLLLTDSGSIADSIDYLMRDQILQSKLGQAAYVFAATYLNREFNFQKIYELLD
ncbi:MAG: glycosyltransferase family 4 protein [Actinomycetota bacterium]